MNANKIINTVTLVCVIAVAVSEFVRSNDSGEFISGWLLGICFVVALIIWAEGL